MTPRRSSPLLITLVVALLGLSSCRKNGGSHHHDDDDHHVAGSAEIEMDWSEVEAEFALEVSSSENAAAPQQPERTQ